MYFSFSNVYSAATRALSNNYGTLLGISVVYILISIAIAVVPVLGSIASIVVTPPLHAGIAYAGLVAYRGRNLQVGDMFKGFSYFGPCMGIYWLHVLMMIVCMIPIFAIMFASLALNNTIDETLGTGLLIGSVVVSCCIMAIISLRLSFAYLISMEFKLGVLDSMRHSWEMSKHISWPLLGVYVVSILILTLSAGLFLLPALFFGFPYFICVHGAAYGLRSEEGVENVF